MSTTRSQQQTFYSPPATASQGAEREQLTGMPQDAVGSSYFTRSKIAEYKAAGVLPFAAYNGKVYVLLGAELVRTGPSGKFFKHMCKSVLPDACLPLSMRGLTKLHREGLWRWS
eukprot:jgi/Chrzof1/2545/Cz11g19180.t1